jgi:hypothetical protein
LSPFAGLVITDAEVSDLLANSDNVTTEPASEQRQLDQALAELQGEIQARRAASAQTGVHLTLSRLTELFGPTEFEEQCLIICLAPEVHRKYDRLYGFLQDDATRRAPSVDLALNLLCAGPAEKLLARAAFDPSAALLKFKLIQLIEAGTDGQTPLLSRALKLDDRIASFLLGQSRMDGRLERFARMVFPREDVLGIIAEDELYRRATSFVETYFADPQSAGRNVVLYLHGPATLDSRLVVEAVCSNFSLPLLVADVEAMKAGPMPFEQAAWLLGREAALHAAVLALEKADCLVAESDRHPLELKSLVRSAKTFSRLTFMFGHCHWQPQDFAGECLYLSIAVSRPDLGACKRLWERSLAACERLADDVASPASSVLD